jgi:ubiquinone/menaquinone biosynthesis C-methylase UbiE
MNSILDVGCGEGFLLEHLPPVDSYIGVDYSDESIKLAKVQSSKFKVQNDSLKCKVDFRQADVYKLPFGDKSFDLVTCLEVLEHLDNYEKALQEIRRVAKKHVILSVPHEPWFQLSNFLRGKYLARLGNHPEHINKWNPNQFKKLISKYFIIKKVVYPFPWQTYLCEL